MSVKAKPLAERVFPKIRRTDTCWLWEGAISNRGYGHVHNPGGSTLAHRVVYELVVGPIPEGLTIDHLCRVRHCVNPAHLEPVTMRENTLRGEGLPAQRARQTHCKHGHPFDEANTMRWRTRRYCRACNRIRLARARLAAR